MDPVVCDLVLLLGGSFIQWVFDGSYCVLGVILGPENNDCGPNVLLEGHLRKILEFIQNPYVEAFGEEKGPKVLVQGVLRPSWLPDCGVPLTH